MDPSVARIFEAALALPENLRGDFAAQLIESLDLGSSVNRTPDEWAAIIMEHSDSLRRGDTELLDGSEVLAALRDELNARLSSTEETGR